MNHIKIKPLSVNESWQGRRFKTPKYKVYEQELMYILPRLEVPKDCKLRIDYIVGYSNKLADIDNFVKPFQDVLQKKYGFNDSAIYFVTIEKQIVKKGDEFIDFRIMTYLNI